MPVEKQLPENHFNTVIRWIKQSELTRLQSLKAAIDTHVSRLGLRVKDKMAVKGLPNGSDQFDSGSVFYWMEKVEKCDTEAVNQVAAIAATIKVRLGV